MNYFKSRRILAPLFLASDAYGCTYVYIPYKILLYQVHWMTGFIKPYYM